MFLSNLIIVNDSLHVDALSLCLSLSRSLSFSQISQMLGNEIKFAVREPVVLPKLFFFLTLIFIIFLHSFTCSHPNPLLFCFVALAFPNLLYEVVFEGEETATSVSIRLYGGALLSLSLIMWNGLYTAEKVIIQWTLLSESCYFGIQFLVTSVTLVELGLLSNHAILLLLSRVLFLSISLSYYYHLGRRPKKI
uniref:Tumor protein p53-inducible protein 11 n=1 Tax=Astyanax mexicanus TaxID=7994 RepID=A0A8B9JEQ3_ASTMX